MADKEKKPFERLPTDVVPRNYKLELKPDLKALTFEGKLEITCEASCYHKISRVPYGRGWDPYAHLSLHSSRGESRPIRSPYLGLGGL